jgi:hypothetical protein
VDISAEKGGAAVTAVMNVICSYIVILYGIWRVKGSS